MKRGVSEIAKCGALASASRHVSSVTPKASSSIASERSQPGLTTTAVAPCGLSSCASTKPVRSTAHLAMSRKYVSR